MRILEPLLINNNQGALASGQLSQQVEFNLAALEGILVLGVSAFFGTSNTEADDIEVSLALSLNPNDTAADLQLLLAGNPDVFWYNAFRRVAAGTPANYGEFPTSTPLTSWADVGGILLLTNPSAHYHSDVSTQIATITIQYKRVLLDADELIPFVALRRR